MSIKRLLFIPMMVLAGTDLFHDGVRLAVPLRGIVFAQALIQPFGLFPRWIAFQDEATVRKKPPGRSGSRRPAWIPIAAEAQLAEV